MTTASDSYRSHLGDLQQQRIALLKALEVAQLAVEVYRDEKGWFEGSTVYDVYSSITDLIYQNLEAQERCRYDIRRLDRLAS